MTRILSNIKKEQGDIKAARDILTELQVETFGSMSRREKTEFILDQIQLCIDSGDWTQAAILGRKISTRYFTRKPKKTPEQLEKERKEKEEAEKKRSVDDPVPEPEDDVTDLKLRYYEQQIMLAKHDDKYLEACKHYRQVLDTELVEEDQEKLEAVSDSSQFHVRDTNIPKTLQRVAWYILLAPYDNEQSDLLHRIKSDSRYSELPREQQLLRLFTTHEIMHWPNIAQSYAEYLGSSDVFRVEGVKSTASASDEKAVKRWDDLRKRVIEHNVRVVAKYYTRIRMPRLCQLLNLSEDETEKYISDLVTAKTIYAKIDRPARIISFAKPRDADDVLNEWSGNMKSLLGLLERIGESTRRTQWLEFNMLTSFTDHLITKEEMMARIAPKAEKIKPRREEGAGAKA